MSGGDTPKQGTQAPPPSTPSGSRFGSFMTQPVLAVALLALLVSVPLAIGGLSGSDAGHSDSVGGPTSTPGPLAGVAGNYSGQAARAGGHGAVQVELKIGSAGRGFLVRSTPAARCAGELRLRSTSSRRTIFRYTETDDPRSCRRRTTVTVRRLGGGGLQFEETQGHRVLLSGPLNRS
jgi:hypothetical protein